MKNFEPGWKVKPLNQFEVQKPEEELTTTPVFSKNKLPMIDMDEWASDPSVLAMRKVFKGMEKCLEKILEKLEISPYDQRIRKWLERALEKFENAWGVANQLGIVIDEKTAPAAYAACLAKVMGSDGIQIPEGVYPHHAEAERVIQEVFK